MFNAVTKILRIKPGEFGLVLIMSVLLLGNDMARQTSGIVGISDFLDAGGTNQFLIVNIINAFLIMVTSSFASLIVDRFDRVKLLQWTALLFAVVFILLRVLLPVLPLAISAGILFIMSQQQWLIFPLFFWVFANDIFTTAQGKRLLPVIGSWSFIGKILGIGAVWISIPFAQQAMTIEASVTLNMVVYSIAFFVILFGLRHVELPAMSKKPEALQKRVTEGWDFIKNVDSFRYLALGIVALMVVDIITEFNFLRITKQSFPEIDDYKRFYSLYLLGAALLSFFVQSFVTGRLLNRLQLRDMFLIVPAIALVTVLIMLFAPILAPVIIATFTLKVTRNTVDSTSRKSLQSLVPAERRGRVSLYLDNYLPALGMILGSVLAGAVIIIGNSFDSPNAYWGYLIIGAIAALIQIFAITKMRQTYDGSLLNWRLKRRRRGKSVLDKLIDL